MQRLTDLHRSPSDPAGPLQAVHPRLAVRKIPLSQRVPPAVLETAAAAAAAAAGTWCHHNLWQRAQRSELRGPCAPAGPCSSRLRHTRPPLALFIDSTTEC